MIYNIEFFLCVKMIYNIVFFCIMFVVFYGVNLYIYDLFHILLSL